MRFERLGLALATANETQALPGGDPYAQRRRAGDDFFL